jgi:hypothetical protein
MNHHQERFIFWSTQALKEREHDIWKSWKSEREELMADNKKLREHLKLILAPQEEDCRFDHNGNCQEHSWFGLEDENCPVKEARGALKKEGDNSL